MRKDSFVRTRLARATALGAGTLAVAYAMLGAGAAQASNFQLGEVEFNTQVTISAGVGVRTEGRDKRLICKQNIAGGSSNTCNSDDGNLNFDAGDLIYAPVRAQGEVEAIWQNFTVYARGQAFYDYVYDHGDLAYEGGNPFYVPNYRDHAGRQSSAGQNASAYDYEIMDLWVRGRFDIGDNQMTVKLGQQSISWGEALFTPLSFAQVNSFDIAKLRAPGSELRDALRSMPAAVVNFELGGGLSFETFYQFDFRPTRAEAAGSFFSTSDVGGRGGSGFGSNGDFDQFPPDATNFFAGGNLNLSVPRGPDLDSSSDGDNWGVSLRYFSPELNNTEFGLYFANVTARSPQGAYITADDDKFISAAELPAAAPGLVAKAVAQYVTAFPNATPAQIAAYQGVAAANVASLAIQENGRNSTIVLTYPKDVQMLGASFNTSIDAIGVSLAGELAWMHDMPVSIDGDTFASAFACTIFPIPGVPCSATPFRNQQSTLAGQLSGTPGAITYGYTREDVYTFMLRGVKTFGASEFPTALIGANGSSFIAEFGGVYVDLPSEKILAYDIYGGANGLCVTDPTDPAYTRFDNPCNSKYEPATDFSAGMTLVASASYPDALFGANLTPSVRYAYGLIGNTPIAGGYTDEASALSFQLDAEYLLSWKASIGYTTFFGAGRQNQVIDRDFFTATISYTF